jgi:Tfp pilus assembly pilus retraction ATPase PilT
MNSGAEMSMLDATRVSDLSFCDLYLGYPTLEARLRETPGSAVSPLPADAALQKDLARLAAQCDEAARNELTQIAFAVRYDDVTYRGLSVPTAGGKVFLLRRLEGAVGSLSSLGVPQAYARRMMTRHLSGLFIVCGESRSGRTMTACAMLKERLLAYGGLAVTGEDPIELPLQGEHGEGFCFQTTVPHAPAGFSDAFNRLLRAGARIIMVDEINTPEAAAAVLQASVGGTLLIVTMRAEDIIQCLLKLHTLASEKLLPENARALLAEGLAGVLYQQMSAPVKNKMKLEAELLFLDDAFVPRTMLRKGEYEHLSSIMQQQMAAMIAENAAASRLVDS